MKIKNTVIYNMSVSELDIDLQNAFSFDYDTEDRFEVIEEGFSNDGHPILIDELIKILNVLKSNGCNYVQIEDDGDHHGYDIAGSLIEKFTEEELQELGKRTKQY